MEYISYLSLLSFCMFGISLQKTIIFGVLNTFMRPLYFVDVNQPFLRFSMKFHGQ